MKSIIKYVYIGLGFLSLGLGMIGVILPILPTTPFLLLSALLFAKSSTKVHQWLLNTKVYHEYIDKMVLKRQTTRQNKRKALLCITTIFIIAIILTPVFIGKAIIFVVLLLHHYFFITKVQTIDE